MAGVAETSADDVPNVDICLAALRSANSDTEVFAALLLVTKLVKAESTDAETRRKIFDAVGFTFLNRLLNTTEVAEGCDINMFRSIGLTLLACFCTDPELATHPQTIAKVPMFNEVISTCKSLRGEDLDSSVYGTVDDCYQCFYAIAASPDGQQQLIRHATVQALCKACTENCYHGHEKALPLLIQLLDGNGHQIWTYYDKVLNQLVESLSRKLKDFSDEKKFSVCDSIFAILSTATRQVIETLPHATWDAYIHQGLFDILRSKIGTKQRDPALRLSSLMIEYFGIGWAFGPPPDTNTKFLLLLVHLSCVEIRMGLEHTKEEERDSRSAVVSSCYNMVELIISFMTSGPSLELNSKQVTQLHSALIGAFGAVTHYLTSIANDKTQYSKPLVQASVRVLGAWLAEETSALREEIYNLLPFLTDIGKEYFYKLKMRLSKEKAAELGTQSDSEPIPVDLLRFLLPGLCHFTAEEKSRKIMVDNAVHELLGEYFNYHWLLFTANNVEYNSEIALTTLCGIFMNFTVQDSEFVKSQSVFRELLNLLMTSLPKQVNKTEHTILNYNMAVLGLMMLRQHPDDEEISQSSSTQNFIRAVIQLFKSCHVLSDGHCKVTEVYQPYWPHISELWYLGIQDMAWSIPQFPWLPKVFLEYNWLRDISQMLSEVKAPTDEDSLILQLSSGILTECAKHDQACRQYIKEIGGQNVAKTMNMQELIAVLEEIK
ncbi:neurochondrin-like isoform X1 [Ptychodera flava]|uniref:neurochondrin-like isoform X1 n=2 Tax=Ptychodera flava TaxID=63121 RepID=UPI00396A983C